MAIHRLSIEDFDEVNYQLVAIHTSLEDYRLAFFINKTMPILLRRNPSDIPAQTKDGNAFFTRFTYEFPENEITWSLIQNKNEIVIGKKNAQNLFADEVSVMAYLIPEFKKVDYFLKIENREADTIPIIEGLQSIDRISTAYVVDAEKIKSKHNLIF